MTNLWLVDARVPDLDQIRLFGAGSLDVSVSWRQYDELMSTEHPPVRHVDSLRRHLAKLVVLTAVLVGSIVVPTATAGASMSGIEPGIASQFLAELNAERGARGIAPLVLDTAITPDATSWAERMAGSGSLVHSNDPRAEIIARGQRTGQITEAWMESSGHRNLVVDPNLGYAGIGIACDSSGQIWAVVQFRRIDTRLGTQTSSARSPVVSEADRGLTCSDQPANTTNAVKRLYSAYFLRSADAKGLSYWKAEMSKGLPLSTVSEAFAASQEFVNRYGSLSNSDFVALVYQNVMGRKADRAGLDYWVAQLRRGLGRGAMMTNFSESPEYRQRTGLN